MQVKGHEMYGLVPTGRIQHFECLRCLSTYTGSNYEVKMLGWEAYRAGNKVEYICEDCLKYLKESPWQKKNQPSKKKPKPKSK